MALDTYGGVQASVAAWATRSDLTATIPDFVTWAHQEINRRLRANVMLASTTLTLTAETIAQPTGFLAFKRIDLDVSPRQRLLSISAEGAMDLSASMASSTYPTHVAKEGTLLRFAPLFSGTTTTAQALYYKSLVALSDDADTNAVMTTYPYLYLFGSLEALFRYLEDDNNAQIYGGQFGALIDSINATEAKDAMSGPLQAVSYAGGVV